MIILSNSTLVTFTRILPHSTRPRRGKISKITIHHAAGNLSVEAIGRVLNARSISTNYAVDGRGQVGMYVEEKDRSWASSSAANDHVAVTIEVANSGGAPDWPVSDIALEKTIDLCVDICQRNDIEKLDYTGGTQGNLTRHNMFTRTICPGPYLQSKFSYIAEEVNRRLVIPADPLAEAVAVLVQAGVIRSPEFWLTNARPGKVVRGEIAAALIIKMAERLRP